MKFKLEIKMDNAAFEGENALVELARILTELSTEIDMFSGIHRGWYCNLVDVNGNTVGRAEMK